jgi:inorganic pyrophosphatase
MSCRVIGVLQIEQKSKGKSERNDRLFAVPRRSHAEQGLRDVRDLSRPTQQELEKFFNATDELEDKRLEIIGWKGRKLRYRRSRKQQSRSPRTESIRHANALRRIVAFLPEA